MEQVKNICFRLFREIDLFSIPNTMILSGGLNYSSKCSAYFSCLLYLIILIFSSLKMKNYFYQ
jgi:hypothetical protein